MSTPTTSPAPAAPATSSPLRPISSIVEWLGYVRTWILGLSPAGAEKYDTKWVGITLGSGYTALGVAPAVRRVGKRIEYRGMFRPGPTPGNFPVSTVLTIAPAGSVPAEFLEPYQVLIPICGDSSTSYNGGRLTINTDGSMQIVPSPHPTPSYALFGIGYTVD